ncbi:MAG: copper-binding protein [Candidatus Competibacteraceae bacterium]|nr:copper-binding protein [Candidatus Competibacteraceae bacterium]MCB1820599.1 copper-binding protein [Candidatus Competibacteraceae bacterium]HRY16166.1 copper-binding protein [Candidatus Competibacteraceae bacterium]
MKKSLVVSALLATLLGMGSPVLAKEAPHDHGAAHAGEAATVSATGTVKSVDAAKGKLVIDHEPIPALNWPQMVMDFQLADKVMADQVKAGDKVQFEMKEGKKGSYTIISIQPAAN